MQTYSGGCHCGSVRFEIELPGELSVHKCNCSICRKSGYLHLIVPSEKFTLLSGQESLVEYRFHTGVARHLFCGTCGIKSYYVPRSHPDSFSVNLNCVDLDDRVRVEIKSFDGRNWSRNIEKIVDGENDSG